MLGSVLIVGADKETRLGKAWEMLVEQGFSAKKGSPDLLVVQKEEDKKSVGIAQAKEIRLFLRERPLERKVKAVLVEEAQAFTDEAQNSLLKILEEPPAFALIILLADKEGSLLPTVVSRCQRIYVKAEPSSKGVKGGSEVRFLNESNAKLKGAPSERSKASPADTADRVNQESPYNLWTKSPEELFDLAKDLSARGKEEALEFVEHVLHQDIELNCPQSVVSKLEIALKELKDANVALKFALEYVFLLHVAKPS